jgi:MFS family permease
LMPFFGIALALLILWSIVSAIEEPIRRAYLNGLIPSQQRATVLSFDSLMGSAGGVVVQPALGRVADVSGYAASYVIAGGIQALAIPLVLLARRERAASDPISPSDDHAETAEDQPA